MKSDDTSTSRDQVSKRPEARSKWLIFFSERGRLVFALLVTFVACLVIDYELYQRQWFLNHFGYGTQEGQIVRKMQRAERLASVADIVTFGSSFIRSSISAEPFLEQGVLPFNYAVSGGGPIYSYYALKQIAPVLLQRRTKPFILLELSLNLLDREWAAEPGGSWSEYQHLFAVARSRVLIARHFALLWSNFHESSQSSHFLSAAIFPSDTYRIYSRSVGNMAVPELLDFVLKGKGKNEFFYGMEDIGGFAPSYSVAPRSPPPVEWTPLPMARYVGAKVAFLKMFIELASETWAQVILLPTPNLLRNYYVALERLSAQLERDYPRVRIIRHPDYGLQRADFDPTGHMNIWGADHLTEWLISYLHLSGDNTSLQQKIQFAFETAALPRFSSWEFNGTDAAADNADPYQLNWSTKSSRPTVATSPWISVTPDRQYVLELSASNMPGHLLIQMATDTQITSAETTPNPPEHPDPARYFLRLTPSGSRIRIRIRYQPPGTEKAASGARIHMNRLFGHL